MPTKEQLNELVIRQAVKITAQGERLAAETENQDAE